MAQFLGKYRATVHDNADPEGRGRLRLQVPAVLGDELSEWAEACIPLAGPTGQPIGIQAVPAVGTGVWVEFEQGDAQLPIWVGCRWTAAPALAPSADRIVIGGAGSAAIVVDDNGIIVDNGRGASIELTGPSVTINRGALAVT